MEKNVCGPLQPLLSSSRHARWRRMSSFDATTSLSLNNTKSKKFCNSSRILLELFNILSFLDDSQVLNDFSFFLLWLFDML